MSLKAKGQRRFAFRRVEHKNNKLEYIIKWEKKKKKQTKNKTNFVASNFEGST
jgi:hypothetical protein